MIFNQEFAALSQAALEEHHQRSDNVGLTTATPTHPTIAENDGAVCIDENDRSPGEGLDDEALGWLRNKFPNIDFKTKDSYV